MTNQTALASQSPLASDSKILSTAPEHQTISSTTKLQNNDIIKSSDFVIIKMPSDGKKIINLGRSEKVRLGKFGQFNSAELVGQLFDLEYEVDRDSLSVAKLEKIVFESNTNNNNQFINDDKTAQSTTQERIEALKAENCSYKDIIQAQIQGSSTFQLKTDQSKAKYINKKLKKFSKSFLAQRPTIKTLCEYYFENIPGKIMDLRFDTLSQLLSLANVHSGSKILVLEDTAGMILASLMQRMGGQGKVLVVHNKIHDKHSIVEQMNFSTSFHETVSKLYYSRIEQSQNELVVIDDLEKVGEWEKRNIKIKNAVDSIISAREILTDGEFDGLVMAVDDNPLKLVKEFTPYLSGSRPVVLYSPFKEMLFETYLYMRSSKDFVNVQLTESWMRQYQVPVESVGTHPQMSMSSSGGFLLSGTIVLENEIDCQVEPLHLKMKANKAKKQRKQ